MIIHARPLPLEILLLRYLSRRMEFSESELINYQYLEKGYEGELRSDEWLQGLTDQWLVLHGLLLEYNGSKFQIDTLIIAYEKIYILDIKNYEGDYYLDGDKWYKKTNSNLKNPLHQLIRCQTELRKLLQSIGYNYPIEAYLIFNNPEFHLYTTTIHSNIIFPTQLKRFLKKLNRRPMKLNQRHHKLAEQLAALHIVESPYSRVPAYHFTTLKKGMFCLICYSIYTDVSKDLCICNHCGCIEGVDDAVLRNVEEYILLFPDRIITTKDIYEWCGCILSKKVIRRVLSKNYTLKGFGPSSNFVIK
nr:nuclease-related domain-containing protein [Neobacillus sp. Marseille-Q6967]